MAASAQIAEMSFSHHAIIDWMLSNPDALLADCAKAFGYTQPWLSTIIHSDAFKAEFARRRGQLDEHIAHGIHAKMAAVSKKALDHLEELLDGTETLDPRLVLDIADRTLHRQGYAPSKAGVSVFAQQNIIQATPGSVSKSVLDEAKSLMRAINGEAVEVPAIENASGGAG
jgi:restriction endonuclease Mrr